MQLRRFLITILASFIIFVGISAQDMTVRSMEPLPMDTYASTHKRLDLNGNACAVVRVSLTVSGATFSGNVVGDVARDGSDYLVYMPQGSKKLWVKHPNYHELEISFGDYGINRLQGLTTYRIIVNIPQPPVPQQKKQTLTLRVTPRDAMVQIDGDVIDGNTTLLTVGTHRFNVAAKGYYTQEGTIEVKQNIPSKLVVELDKKPVLPPTDIQHEITSDQTAVNSQEPQINTTQVSYQVLPPQTFTVKGVSFTMIPVEGGTFTMGATPEISNPNDDERPTHKVTLSSYYIGETEVTQELWLAVMGKNPSLFKGNKNPVEQVSWNECQEFIRKLNKMVGKRFRLPTEAEWEFAARGGNKSKNTPYSGSDKTNEAGWYIKNSFMGTTHPVKQKAANELGIYDMSGNVNEWCQDYWGNYSYATQYNPQGPDNGIYRINRGGAWNCNSNNCRISIRNGNKPIYSSNDVGLRLALSE